jgi:hypothetical protein
MRKRLGMPELTPEEAEYGFKPSVGLGDLGLSGSQQTAIESLGVNNPVAFLAWDDKDLIKTLGLIDQQGGKTAQQQLDDLKGRARVQLEGTGSTFLTPAPTVQPQTSAPGTSDMNEEFSVGTNVDAILSGLRARSTESKTAAPRAKPAAAPGTAPTASPTPVSISDATIDAIALRASTLVYRGLEETMRAA